MAKFYIKKDGTPGVCNAEKGNCPYGDAQHHFPSQEAAQEYTDKVNLEKVKQEKQNSRIAYIDRGDIKYGKILIYLCIRGW